MRVGLGRSPEADLALALGFPRYFEVTDANLSSKQAEAAAMEATSQGVRTWPRPVAHRALRAFGAWDDDDRAPLVADGKEVDEAELAAIMARELVDDHAYGLCYLAEALFGPEIASSTALDAMEQRPDEFVAKFDDLFVPVTRALGHMVRRLPARKAEGALARLAALKERYGQVLPGSSAWKALCLVTEGRAAAEKVGYRPDGKGKPLAPGSLEYVYDDPAFVADHVIACGWDESSGPSVRMVVLGGDAVIDYYASIWPKLPAKLRKQAEAEFSLLAPSIVARITGKTK